MTTLASIEKRISVLRGQLQPPAAVGSAISMAERLGLELDDWQRDALSSDARQLLLNISRQGGKSTVAAVLGLHEVLTKPNRRVLMVSPGERQSKLLFATLMRYYKALGRPVAATTENKLSLELSNGSDVYALPSDEDRIRGFSAVSLLLADEASRISDGLMAATRPMLATTSGRIVAMSTPNGPVGWWHTAWSEGGDDWLRYEVPATSIPRISPEFLERERRALPKLIYDAEYCCKFTQAADAVFDADDINAALIAMPGIRLFDAEDSHVA